jgi:hypothetical protein
LDIERRRGIYFCLGDVMGFDNHYSAWKTVDITLRDSEDIIMLAPIAIKRASLVKVAPSIQTPQTILKTRVFHNKLLLKSGEWFCGYYFGQSASRF